MDKYEQLSIIDKYRHQNFLSINKNLIEMFGLVKAGFMSYVMDKCHYFLYKDQTNDGWFYIKDKDLVTKLGLTRHTLKKCRDELAEIGLIEIKTEGLPPCIFYKINFDILKSIENKIQSKSKYSLKDFRNKERGNYYVNVTSIGGNGYLESEFYDGKKRKFRSKYNLVNTLTNKVVTEKTYAKSQKGEDQGNIRSFISFPTKKEAEIFLNYITKSKLIKYLLIAYTIDQHVE
ncbi:MAG: hypothetical protein ACOCWG_06280, partial [bacterium]